MADATVVSSPEGIACLRLATIIRAYEMEVGTGLKLTRNVPTVKSLRQQYGITATTKKQAIVQLRELLSQKEEEVGFN